MDVTGSGTGTMIVMGVATSSPVISTNFILFTTSDGINFTNHILNISGFSPGGSSGICGVTFYTNNTFLIRTSGGTGNNLSLIQFPANIASLGAGPIPATQIGSYPLPSVLSTTAFIDYKNSGPGGLFAVASPQNAGGGSANGQVALYDDPVVGSQGCALLQATTNYPHLASNGNLAGAVALGGAGYSQYIFSLDCNNGVRCSEIISVPAQPPTISSQPGSHTFYPPYTLSVSALGFCPLTYQWQESNSVTGTFTNLPGQTSNTLSITALITNYFQVVVSNPLGSATSAVAQVTSLSAVTNAAVSTLWRVAPGQTGFSWLSASDNNERGIAYDPHSQRVVVGTASALYVLNANNGTNIETLSLTGVSFGGLYGGCDQVGIADDGTVYAGNVVSGGGTFNLYRWTAPSNSVTATHAFTGDPGNGNAGAERWGDTMAVRGAGPNTQILLASRAAAPGGTNVVLLLPNDGAGLTYSSTLIAVSGVPAGFAGYGISFGAGNTFWAKSAGGDLYQIAFDPVAATGTVVFDYPAPGQIGSALIGLGVDFTNNILASVQPNDNPNDVQLFQLTGTADAPVLFDQGFFATDNPNGNDNAAIVVKYPRLYALDVNNGIVALTYGLPATTAPSIQTPPASVTAYTTAPSVTFSVGAIGSLPLYYQWQLDATNIPGATGSAYTITNPMMSQTGYYDVIVHNIAGAVTSTPPALLTLVLPVTNPRVTPVWNISAGTNSSVNGPYLTTSGFETRGLAFDLTTSNLFIADHNYIHLYNGTNGQYVGDLNTAGLPNGGANNWTIDQIGVADDGTLYSANLSLDGTAFSIISYSPGSYTPNYAYGGASGGSDLNTLDPSGDRWGDTMAVRGSGPDTQILFGSYNGTNVALFTTADGINFTPAVIAVSGGVPLGFSGLGIAFGTNNTFYAKGGHYYNLRRVSFDTTANAGAVLQNYVAGSQVPNDLTGLGVDVTNNILGGVCYDDTPHDVQLYLLSGNSNAPALFEQDFFPSQNVNSQENSVVALKGGWGFGLDVNNGVVAFTYSRPDAPAVKLTQVTYAPGNTVLAWNNTFDGHAYQVQYKTGLQDPAWINLGSPVTAVEATASYSDSTAGNTTRFYRVISQ